MAAERQYTYLAYGSNLHPRRLEARVGAVDCMGVVELPGWSLRFDKRGGDGSAKANIRPEPGINCVAYAAAFTLRRDQVRRLDVFEGCGYGYETLPITARLGGKRLSAFTYVTPLQWLSERMRPFDWYIDLIVSGARYHGFDEAYIERITAHAVWKDADFRRARAQLLDLNLPLPAHYKR